MSDWEKMNQEDASVQDEAVSNTGNDNETDVVTPDDVYEVSELESPYGTSGDESGGIPQETVSGINGFMESLSEETDTQNPQQDAGIVTEDTQISPQDVGMATKDTQNPQQDVGMATEDTQTPPQRDYDWGAVGREPARQYMPLDPPQKSNNKVMIVVMVLLFTLLAGLCIYVLVTLSKGIDRLSVKKDVEYESESDDPWAEILGEEDEDMASDEKGDADTPQDSQGDADSFSSGYFDKADFADESWKEAYENHNASEFTGPYYEEFVDCIDESTSYQIKREFEEYTDKTYNICIRASYVQIEGDIPNLDEINDRLKSEALSDLEWFKKKKSEYQELCKKYETGIRSDTRSFVTFNDAETLSVAVQNKSDFSYDTGLGVQGININLVTGTIMDNTQILNLEDEFGEEFRQRSNKQNGNTYGIELFSNVEIVSMLNQEDSIIIFYTPIGMEVGYAYDKDGYNGWVTISMQDYEKYLKGL